MKTTYKPPKAICLYNGGSAENFNIREIAAYVSTRLPGARVEVRPAFATFAKSAGKVDFADLAKRFATIRILDPSQRKLRGRPFPAEIEYEQRRLQGGGGPSGVFYDGSEFQRIYCEIMPPDERSREFLHIVFTSQLLGTWDEGDGRYHARVSIYGLPSIVSTRGVIEGPAKPRDYYLKSSLGAGAPALDKEFEGKFIDYDDPRLTAVVKGYAMQAVFYHVTGDPFCTDKGCRLFNAHWQEEMLAAQLGGTEEYCPRHRQLLEELQ